MRSADWDRKYAEREPLWSAEPNRFVVEELSGLTPGSALDLACGEGRNAIWLAGLGWRVTAVDFSAVAVRRAAAIAGRAGVSVDWVVADVLEHPLPVVDLVLVAYLQLPAAELAAVLGRAGAAVAPGGTLLAVGHDLRNLTDGAGGPRYPEVLYTPEAVVAALPGLTVLRAERVRRPTDEGEAIDTLMRCVRPTEAADLPG